MAVIQAGGMYLIPTDERPRDDLPTTHLQRTMDGLDALTDAANVLIYDASQHPADCFQEAADTLIGKGKQAHKMMYKLDGMLPSDDFIMTMNSYGPDLMAEYATNAAIIVTTSFAMDILASPTNRPDTYLQSTPPNIYDILHRRRVSYMPHLYRAGGVSGFSSAECIFNGSRVSLIYDRDDLPRYEAP
jgi:hypothetical protein